MKLKMLNRPRVQSRASDAVGSAPSGVRKIVANIRDIAAIPAVRVTLALIAVAVALWLEPPGAP
jgi:hypothetical protein